MGSQLRTDSFDNIREIADRLMASDTPEVASERSKLFAAFDAMTDEVQGRCLKFLFRTIDRSSVSTLGGKRLYTRAVGKLALRALSEDNSNAVLVANELSRKYHAAALLNDDPQIIGAIAGHARRESHARRLSQSETLGTYESLLMDLKRDHPFPRALHRFYGRGQFQATEADYSAIRSGLRDHPQEHQRIFQTASAIVRDNLAKSAQSDWQDISAGGHEQAADELIETTALDLLAVLASSRHIPDQQKGLAVQNLISVAVRKGNGTGIEPLSEVALYALQGFAAEGHLTASDVSLMSQYDVDPERLSPIITQMRNAGRLEGPGTPETGCINLLSR